MSLLKSIRKLYIRSTDFTRDLQGNSGKLVRFYRLWSYIYDFSVGLDPAFDRQMKQMVSRTVRPGDRVLDIGCGTGISSFHAAEIAREIIALDPSSDMLRKLTDKIRRRGGENIKTLHSPFPGALPDGALFDSIISSFAIVHFTPSRRKTVYQQIFAYLKDGGRLGLFAAQGEIAGSFETRAEIHDNLVAAGFADIDITDVSDIYRIVLAVRKSKQ